MQLSIQKIYAQTDKIINYYQIVNNKIVYLTPKNLNILAIGEFPQKIVLPIGSKEIVKFCMNDSGQLAILYVNWFLQVRSINCISEIKYKFSQLDCDKKCFYPEIKWNAHQIYLIYQYKIQVFNLELKQRKEYNEILSQLKNQKIITMFFSTLMDKEKVVTLQLKNQLIFTLIPIPVTQIKINNITQILPLTYGFRQSYFPRQYLAILVDNRILKIYNYINMKQIYQIQYSSKKNEKIKMTTDPLNQFLLIGFYDSKLKIIKNFLLKVNTQYYYTPTTDYFKQDQPFFIWQLQVPLKLELSLFLCNTLDVQEKTILSITMCSFINQTLKLLSFQVNSALRNQIPKSSQKNIQWQQLRQWKDLTTSYMELNQDIIYQKQKNINLIAKSEQQLKDYQKLKNDFDNMVKKFTQSQNLNHVVADSIDQQDLQQKIQAQWVQCFRKYLIENKFELNSQGLLKMELQRLTKQSLNLQNKQQQIIQSIKAKDNIQINNQQQSNFNQQQSDLQAIKIKVETPKTVHVSPYYQEQTFSENNSQENSQSPLFVMIEKSISKGLQPLTSKLQSLEKSISRIQDVHLQKLKKCQYLVEKNKKQYSDLNNCIKGYFQEMLAQVTFNINGTLNSFTKNIEESTKKITVKRQQSINYIKKYVDQQILNRCQIFETDRLSIQNHLSKIRRKMLIENIYQQQDMDQSDQQQFVKKMLEKADQMFHPQRLSK